jgi:fructose-1,6-bisphosphatase/inositol monophosphatase family enzyme
MAFERELDLARSVAVESANLALSYQRGITAEEKPDHSPVTRADKECEALISARLREAFPEDGLLGEEGASVESRSGRRWIIDPIDGTRDYLRGNPLWAPMIALESGDDVVVGVIHFAGYGGTYWATRGGGAFQNGNRLHVSNKKSASESVLCMNQFGKLDAAKYAGRLLPWLSRFWAIRGLGGTPDAMMVAAGQAEIWIEPAAAPWDYAAPKLIVEEAGGIFRNFDGGSSIYGVSGIALTPGLEHELEGFLL